LKDIYKSLILSIKAALGAIHTSEYIQSVFFKKRNRTRKLIALMHMCSEHAKDPEERKRPKRKHQGATYMRLSHLFLAWRSVLAIVISRRAQDNSFRREHFYKACIRLKSRVSSDTGDQGGV
jgi:hypothetical protein